MIPFKDWDPQDKAYFMLDAFLVVFLVIVDVILLWLLSR